MIGESKTRIGAGKRPGRLELGLRTRLIALLLAVSLIPLGALTWVSISTQMNQVASTAISTMRATFEEKSAFAQNLIGTYQGFIETLAEDPRVVAMNAPEVTKWLRGMLKAGHLRFQHISLVDPSGIVIGGTQTDENLGKLYLGDRDYFAAAMAGETHIGEPTASKTTGDQIVVIASPIRRDGTVVGVLTGVLVTTTLRENLNATGLAKEGIRAYLVSPSGKLITTPEAWGEVNPEELEIDPAVLDAIRNGQQTAAQRYRDPVGNIVTGVYGPIQGLGWGLVIEQDASAIDNSVAVTVRSAVGLVVGAALLVVLVALVAGRGIARPILKLRQQLQQLASADADLTTRLEVRSSDEIGQAAGAFNHLMESLQRMIRTIADLSAQSDRESQSLSDSAERAATFTEQISSSVQQVSEGASQQAASSQEVRQTITQLQEAIEQIAQGAQQAAREVQRASQALAQMSREMDGVAQSTAEISAAAQQVEETARAGAGAVGQTLEGMERIRQAADDTGARIQELEVLSVKIGDISEVITAIAEQTNLLALNAAIEAARAGEHGRGFAVVAEEVRKLAERSANSAKEIGELIEAVQSSTGNAVKAVQTARAEVMEGSRLAAEAREALEQMVAIAERAARGVQEISAATGAVRARTREVVQAFDSVSAVTEENTAATEEMAAGAAQVTNAIDRITEVARKNAASTQQVSAAIAQLTTTVEAVAAAARSMAEVTAKLQHEISRFTL